MQQGDRVGWLGGIAWAAAAAAVHAAPCGAWDAADVAAQNGPAVLLIVGAAEDGTVLQGSGCVVDAAAGLALTTAHQVRNLDTVRGLTQDGAEFRFEVVEVDAAADLAVLRSDEALPAAAVVEPEGRLDAGAGVVALSSPMGIAFSTHIGHVTNTRFERRGREVLLTDLPLTNGSSGGPVFDERGTLIGLVSERIDAAASVVVSPLAHALPMLCRAGALLPVCGGEEDPAAAAYNRAVREPDAQRKIPLYNEAIRLRPAFFEAWFNLAAAQGAAGLWEEAAASYGQARDLRPDSVRVRRNLGQALIRLNRPAEGAAELERAATLSPDDPRIHNDLGEAYRRAGRPADAVAAYERALVLRPGYPAAHFNLALAFVTLERPGEAVRHFEAYLAQAPDAVDAGEVRARIESLQSKEAAE